MPSRIHWLQALAPLVAVSLVTTPAQPDEPTGNNFKLLPLSAGEVPFRGQQVRYIFARTQAPTPGQQSGGSILAFVPPLDLARDDAGLPDIVVSDPDDGGDYMVEGPEGKLVAATASDLVRLVRERKLDPKARVLATFTLVLYDDLALKGKLLETARTQIAKKVEERGDAADLSWLSGDLERASRSVVIMPAKEVRLTCETPGLDEVKVVLGGSPNLGGRVTVQAAVPLRFLTQAFSRAGVSFKAEFVYEAFAESTTTLSAQRVVDAVVDVALQASGKGGLTHDKAGGTRGQISILTTRDQVQRMMQSARLRERLVISGGSLEEINLLLGYLQRNDADLFAVAVKEIEDWVANTLKIQQVLTQPGVAQSLQEALNKEELSEQETEQLLATMEAESHRVSKGGGGSFLFFSVGGGGGKDDATAKARREQERKFARQFLSDLKTYRKDGSFPVHPDLSYCIVSTQRLQKDLDQFFQINRAGRVTSNLLTVRFNTREPTLKPSTASDAALERQADVDRARKELESLRQGKDP